MMTRREFLRTGMGGALLPVIAGCTGHAEGEGRQWC